MSNVLLVIGVLILGIAFSDNFEGAPTDPGLLNLLMVALQIMIMFVFSTNWFRKSLINCITFLVYAIVAWGSELVCHGKDQFFEGKGGKNYYPLIQIIPDWDHFKYHASCSPDDIRSSTKKSGIAIMVINILIITAGYYAERYTRKSFGKKWVLIKNNMDMEKKLKIFQDNQDQRGGRLADEVEAPTDERKLEDWRVHEPSGRTDGQDIEKFEV